MAARAAGSAENGLTAAADAGRVDRTGLLHVDPARYDAFGALAFGRRRWSVVIRGIVEALWWRHRATNAEVSSSDSSMENNLWL